MEVDGRYCAMELEVMTSASVDYLILMVDMCIASSDCQMRASPDGQM